MNAKNELTNAVGLASSYDANGNLTKRVYDATGPKSYVYLYDGESQLIEMRTDTSATPTGSHWRTRWAYDGVGTTNNTNDTNAGIGHRFRSVRRWGRPVGRRNGPGIKASIRVIRVIRGCPSWCHLGKHLRASNMAIPMARTTNRVYDTTGPKTY